MNAYDRPQVDDGLRLSQPPSQKSSAAYVEVSPDGCPRLTVRSGLQGSALCQEVVSAEVLSRFQQALKRELELEGQPLPPCLAGATIIPTILGSAQAKLKYKNGATAGDWARAVATPHAWCYLVPPGHVLMDVDASRVLSHLSRQIPGEALRIATRGSRQHILIKVTRVPARKLGLVLENGTWRQTQDREDAQVELLGPGALAPLPPTPHRKDPTTRYRYLTRPGTLPLVDLEEALGVTFPEKARTAMPVPDGEPWPGQALSSFLVRAGIPHRPGNPPLFRCFCHRDGQEEEPSLAIYDRDRGGKGAGHCFATGRHFNRHQVLAGFVVVKFHVEHSAPSPLKLNDHTKGSQDDPINPVPSAQARSQRVPKGWSCGAATKVFRKGRARKAVSLRCWRWDCPRCAPILRAQALAKYRGLGLSHLLTFQGAAPPTLGRRLRRRGLNYLKVSHNEATFILVTRNPQLPGLEATPVPETQVEELLTAVLGKEEKALNGKRKVSPSRGLLPRIPREEPPGGEDGEAWEEEIVPWPLEVVARRWEEEGLRVIWVSPVEVFAFPQDEPEPGGFPEAPGSG